MITSVTDAAQFIRSWAGLKEPLSSPLECPLPPVVADHSVFQQLDQELGLIWHSNDHPLKAVLNTPSHPLSLFEYQDLIISPQKFEHPDPETGVITFGIENQGVWLMGFQPTDPTILWVFRDWPDFIPDWTWENRPADWAEQGKEREKWGQ